MKVLGVYDKDNEIRCFNKSAFFVMKKFFDKHPEYGYCYFKNLETLKLIKVDEFNDDKQDGQYNGLGNAIIFSRNNTLGRELFHVASYDKNCNIFAIDSHLGIEAGLIAGMTEYLIIKVYELSKAHEYPFEAFCIKMLDDIPGLFKPYFIPNHEEFINLFPNKRSIYSLMYALNAYHENTAISNFDLHKTDEAIKGVIDSLISIEISKENNKSNLIKYSEKFMDEITSQEIKDFMSEINPKYSHYANRQINIRIRRIGE